MRRMGYAGLLAALMVSAKAWSGVPDNAVIRQIDGATHTVGEWRSLAEQGDENAQQVLALALSQGAKGQTNDAEAMKWARKLADKGRAEEQYILGTLYRLGRGAPRNDTKAIKWLKLAAEQNYGPAQYQLGDLYDRGQLVTKDDPLWPKLHDPQWTKATYGTSWVSGYLKDDSFTSVTLKNPVEAIRWYKAAVAQGELAAMVNLGNIYRERKNGPEAIRLFRMAAGSLGNVKDPTDTWVAATAAFNLGLIYDRGDVVARDEAEAARNYLKAAEAGIPWAQSAIAKMYAEGSGVAKDEQAAKQWQERAKRSYERIGWRKKEQNP